MDDVFYDILGLTKNSICSTENFPHYESADASGLPIFPLDVSNIITTEQFKIKFDEQTLSYPITKLRRERNILLTDTDWIALPDVNISNKDEWMTYRQQLRDLTATQTDAAIDLGGNLINVIYPTKPN